MRINKSVATAMVLLGLLIGALGGGLIWSDRLPDAEAAPLLQEATTEPEADDDDDSDLENETDDDNEAEEAVAPDQDVISAAEAQAAAEKAYPDAKAIEVELEHENGHVIYEVELNNGLEVMVDATTGEILGAEEEDD